MITSITNPSGLVYREGLAKAINFITRGHYSSIPVSFASSCQFCGSDKLQVQPAVGIIMPMEDEYHIAYRDEPEWEIIGGGLRKFNIQQAGPELGKPLCFVLIAPDQSIVGGVIGETHWEWLHIITLWIKEDLRKRGYGHSLMAVAEEEALQRGAKNAYLDTFSFQAPDFYKKHGYEVFGTLDNFPPGHQRLYLTKKL